MNRINYKLYKVSSLTSMKIVFVEAESEKHFMEYMAVKWVHEPSSVVEILNNGRTPKVAVYTNHYYKKLTNKVAKSVFNPNSVREINGILYRLRDTEVGTVWFVECRNEMELMEYIAYECGGIPLKVVHMATGGSTPKVAVYSNTYYKDLIKRK